MKKIFLFILTITFVILLSGCKLNKNSSYHSNKISEETPVGYKIEKIILSKGYQSLEPNAEIVKKNKDIKIMASLGMIECSGITIDKITQNDNQINIYTSRLLEDKPEISIPQVIIDLENFKFNKLKNLKFNIINKNYEPINLKFNKKQILSNIYAEFNIVPTTIPDVNLVKQRDDYIWDLTFTNIFDKNVNTIPLVNLNIKANANTGEIISSTKDTISKYIDDGIIVDYVPNIYILYKKNEEKQNELNTDECQSLWIYNLNTHNKKKVYLTSDQICSAKFSPDYKNIALIESDNDVIDVYNINLENKITNKITPLNHNHIKMIKWKDKQNVYLLNTDKHNSTLLCYNLKNNDIKNVLSIKKDISEFDFYKDSFIITEFKKDKNNQKIYFTKDCLNFDEIGNGHNIQFLNNNTIIYLKNIQNKDENILCSYNLNENNTSIQHNLSIENYTTLNENELLVTSKNTCNNNYTLIKYNTLNESITPIAKTMSHKIFYDEKQNKGYLNITPTIKDMNRNIIYLINLNKLSTAKY